MNHYIDIKVLPDPEFTSTVLLNALYSKCHRALGQNGNGEVGVSFPHYKKTLGDILRLHGSYERLSQVMSEPWLKSLSDYTKVSDILAVPATVQYRIVKRIQKRTPQNKRKRAVAKGWLTAEEAWEKFNDEDYEPLNQPYANLKSLSSNNNMKVFIEHGPIKNEPVLGTFSSYGLSPAATIPWFECDTNG